MMTISQMLANHVGGQHPDREPYLEEARRLEAARAHRGPELPPAKTVRIFPPDWSAERKRAMRWPKRRTT